MRIAELWRYPVKSLRGEPLEAARLLPDGSPATASSRSSTEVASSRLACARGSSASRARSTARGRVEQRFDVLPLAVVTDGGLDAFGYDRRRLRPNIVIEGVARLAEKTWPGRMLKIGGGAAYVAVARPRTRCVMTTFDPDTLEQDRGVLHHIVEDLDAAIALDCSVVRPGTIRVGDTVDLIPRGEVS